VLWFVVPAELTLVLVLDGEVPLGAAVLLEVPELPGEAELLGAPVTRVSLLAAVPPCGLTDWDAVVPPLPPGVVLLAGAFTFWFALVFWLVLALVLTFVLVLVGVNELLIV
jgi:hypothetical protein